LRGNNCLFVLRRWRHCGRRYWPLRPQRGGRYDDIRELGERGIVLRSLREGIDASIATGRMVAGVLTSLAELGRERRAAAR